MRNISDKLAEKIKTHDLCSVAFFFFENRAVCEITWKNIVEPDRPQMPIWCIRITYWIPKATNTHSEYVVLTAFPCNNDCTNAPQCYVIRTLPVVWLYFQFHHSRDPLLWCQAADFHCRPCFLPLSRVPSLCQIQILVEIFRQSCCGANRTHNPHALYSFLTAPWNRTYGYFRIGRYWALNLLPRSHQLDTRRNLTVPLMT
jgi:hypothetical protein